MKFALVAFLLCASASGVRAELLFEDSFSERLKPGWTWIRENPAAWKVGQGVLRIRVEPGNMWGPENSGRNVLVRTLPKSEKGWEITVTVKNRPTEQYEQVDLVAYYNDSNMVKIGQELVDGKLSIVMGREEKDRTRTIAIIPLQTETVELKAVIRDGTITGSFRPAGASNWTVAGTCTLPGSGDPRVAIQCYQGPGDKEHWAEISQFKIRTPEK